MLTLLLTIQYNHLFIIHIFLHDFPVILKHKIVVSCALVVRHIGAMKILQKTNRNKSAQKSESAIVVYHTAQRTDNYCMDRI